MPRVLQSIDIDHDVDDDYAGDNYDDNYDDNYGHYAVTFVVVIRCDLDSFGVVWSSTQPLWLLYLLYVDYVWWPDGRHIASEHCLYFLVCRAELPQSNEKQSVSVSRQLK